MLKAALFVIPNNWNCPKSPSKGKQKDKQWNNHIMEYDSATQRSTSLIKARTWTNQKKKTKKTPQLTNHIMINKSSQAHKNDMIPLI